MWTSTFQQGAHTAEIVLTPRRPRTPLRIARDLAEIVTAQAQPQRPRSVQKQSRSGSRNGTRTAQSAATVAPGSLSHRERRPVDSATSAPGPSAATAATPKAKPDSPGFALESGPAEKACSHLALSKPLQRPSHPKASKMSRGHVHPESRAKAREPTDTQRLSGDLQLLADATCRSPAGDGGSPRRSPNKRISVGLNAVDTFPNDIPREMEHSFVSALSGQTRHSRRGSHRNPGAYDRPWRTSPRGRASQICDVDRAASRASTRKTLLAGRAVTPGTSDVSNSNGAHRDDSPSRANASRSAPRASALRSGASSGEKRGSAENDQSRDLWKVAAELKVQLDVIKSAFEVFKAYATKRDGTPSTATRHQDIINLVLTKPNFAQVLLAITGAASVDELPSELRYNTTFATADRDGSEDVDFSEFTTWYARHGFSEEILLTREQREIREVARKFDIVDTTEIERMKEIFDQYDTDKSGTIEFEEFEKALHTMLKVPAHLELPVARVKQFWNETDLDSSGSIGFEEFLVFYAKVFNTDGTENTSPLEKFYRGIRPNAMTANTPSAGNATVARSRKSMVSESGGSHRTRQHSIHVNNYGGASKRQSVAHPSEVASRATTGPTFFPAPILKL